LTTSQFSEPVSPQALPIMQPIPAEGQIKQMDGLTSPQPSASTSNGSSPAPSSAGYSTSISRSPSPESPSSPPTALSPKPKDDNADFPTSISALTIQDATEIVPSGTDFVASIDSRLDDQ